MEDKDKPNFSEMYQQHQVNVLERNIQLAHEDIRLSEQLREKLAEKIGERNGKAPDFSHPSVVKIDVKIADKQQEVKQLQQQLQELQSASTQFIPSPNEASSSASPSSRSSTNESASPRASQQSTVSRASPLEMRRAKEAAEALKALSPETSKAEKSATQAAYRFAADSAAITARGHINGKVRPETMRALEEDRAKAGDPRARAEGLRHARDEAAIIAGEHKDGKVRPETMRALEEDRAKTDNPRARAEGLRHARDEAAIKAREFINNTVFKGTVDKAYNALENAMVRTDNLQVHPKGKESQTIETMTDANPEVKKAGLVDRVRSLRSQFKDTEPTGSDKRAGPAAATSSVEEKFSDEKREVPKPGV